MSDGTAKPVLLLVDDDKMVRRAVRRWLENNYDVREAPSPVEAIAMIRDGLTPTLIICDLEMPRMTGEEFLEVRSKDPQLSRIPVLMVSAAVGIEGIATRYSVPYVVKRNISEIVDKVTTLKLP